MRVRMFLPALTEATSPLFRPIKYSLFPPLGLATLAAYLHPDDEVTIHDEHVERLDLPALLAEGRPDLVVIQVYITSARRSGRSSAAGCVTSCCSSSRPDASPATRRSSS